MHTLQHIYLTRKQFLHPISMTTVLHFDAYRVNVNTSQGR